ncbi:STY13 [Scenedesmus sp. PABB004]|nr:STY13 [Scenedesmus sp. PABB004]
MHARDGAATAPELHLGALDGLALEYLARAELIEDGAASPSSDEGAAAAAAAAHAAREAVRRGDVAAATAVAARFCSAALQDQRLAFRLKRQQFIELLRRADAAGDAAALACARQELAPLALDAYPEAYCDFKRVLLMLVQPHAAQAHEDWSLAARDRLAELLHHTVLRETGWTAARLAQQLAYLLHLFALFTSGAQGGGGGAQLLQAPAAELAEGLLLEGRDEGPLPPDISGQGSVERDVQALMAAVSIPRQVALDALKAAGGDAAEALGRQLMLLRLDTRRVDALVWEYAAARGLVEPDEGAPAPPDVAAAGDMDADAEPPPASIAAAARAAAAAQTSPGSSPGKAGKRGSSGGGGAQAGGPPSPLGAPAAAAGGAAAAAGAGAELRSESQSPPYKVPRWRSRQTPSRFRGSPSQAAAAAAAVAAQQEQQQQGQQQAARELQQVVVELAAGGSSAASLPGKQQQQQPAASPGKVPPGAEALVEASRAAAAQQRWQALQASLKSLSASSAGAAHQAAVQQGLTALQGLVRAGSFAEAEARVEELAPGLLAEQPALRFELTRCQFVQLIRANQLPAALQLARAQLTPLAQEHPELLPALRGAMAALLPGPPGGGGGGAGALGLEPPRLVRLLHLLLAAHKGWFRLQRCADPFAAALGLDALLAPDGGGGGGGAPSAAAAAAATPGAGGAAASPAAAPAAGGAGGAFGGYEDPDMLLGSEEEGGPALDEGAVLQVMEVLELPRGTALELLAEAGGDAQAELVAHVSNDPRGNETRLLPALRDSMATTLLLALDYDVRDEFDALTDPVPINRNVTIAAPPGAATPLLDLRARIGRLDVCGDCTFKFSGVAIANESHRGTGTLISFLRGQLGARVIHAHSPGVRLACPTTASSLAVVNNTIRSALLPGPAGPRQLAAALPEYRWRNRTYLDVFAAEDISSDVPLTLVEGNLYVGGYALQRLNATRVCEHVVSADCVRDRSPEACLAELTAQLLGQARQLGGGGGTVSGARAAAVAVPVTVASLLLAAGVAAVVRRRRLLAQLRAHLGSGGARKGALVSAASGTATRGSSATALASSGPGSLGDGSPLPPARGRSEAWEVHSAQTAPQLPAWATAAPGGDEIHLGECLGAGSFARVFRGRWRNADVAVKVISHDSTASEAVRREVELMLRMRHPNVVGAFHAVTRHSTRSAAAAAAALPPRLAQGGSAGGGSAGGGGTGRSASGAPALDARSGGRAAAGTRPGRLLLPLQAVLASADRASVQAQPGTPAPGAAPRPTLSAPSWSLSPASTGLELGGVGSLELAARGAGAASGALSLLPPPPPKRAPAPGLPEARPEGLPGVAGSSSGVWAVIQHSPVQFDDDHAQASPAGDRSVPAETWLVQELADLGTLGSIAARCWSPSVEGDAQMRHRLLLLRDVARGLAALHAERIVHRDLNSSNCLVCSDPAAETGMTAKLADLGLSRVMKERATHRTTRTTGTLSHMPPELLQFGRSGPSTDIYSFGVMMWELFSLQQAFKHLHMGQLLQTVVVDGLRPYVSSCIPDDYALLMCRCWAKSPAQRPSAEQLLECLQLMLDDREAALAADAGVAAAQQPATRPRGA